jgi:galactokinase
VNIEQLRDDFEKIYGEGESRAFFCPGRVNLIGEHTDYNGGNVFPCALTFGTYGIARKRGDTTIRLASANFDLRVETGVDDLVYDRGHGWANYPKGVVSEFVKLGMRDHLSGFDLLVSGTIPNGAGLSSSASVSVLTAFVVNALFERGLGNVELALLAQRVERDYIGLNCGIMDQFAVAMGKRNHAILLNCGTLKFEYVPVDLNGMKIVIANTNKRRELSDSKYNERRFECEKALSYLRSRFPVGGLCDISPDEFEQHKELIPDETLRKRAEHAIRENGRTLRSVRCLTGGDVEEFGRLMIQSHESLRDLYDVTGPHLDALVEEALKAPGVIGSRMTGAGFGGCTVSIVAEDAVVDFTEAVGRGYAGRTGLKADFYIADINDGVLEIVG